MLVVVLVLGILVAVSVSRAGRQKPYGSPEDMHVDIWDPRTGKTSSRAIPAILSPPGPVLTTSNKRDVLDTSRDVRAVKGQVWAFDPQRIALERPTWWWNPLSYVTDDVKAAKLAAHFASGSRAGDARADPYFDNAGQDLLAGFLLAAALDGLPITKAFTWTTTPGDETPVDILREHGYEQMADAVDGQVNGEPRRRDSVYGTAAQMASCLKVCAIAQWVTPVGGNMTGEWRASRFGSGAKTWCRPAHRSSGSRAGGTAGSETSGANCATVGRVQERDRRDAPAGHRGSSKATSHCKARVRASRGGTQRHGSVLAGYPFDCHWWLSYSRLWAARHGRSNG